MRIAPLAAVLAALGCGPAPVPETPDVPVLDATFTPAEGVVLLDAVCTPGAAERCDALDSDCDGAIDEGCSDAVAGALDVALAWSGPADVDLAVVAPDGTRSTAAVDAGPCGEVTGDSTERVALSEAGPGEYRVLVTRSAACGEGPVTVSVSVEHQGSSSGPYNRSLADGEQPILTITLQSPALQSPALQSPALQSPALQSPGEDPAPAEE